MFSRSRGLFGGISASLYTACSFTNRNNSPVGRPYIASCHQSSSSSTETNGENEIPLVGYVSDIEGNLNYWHRYVQISKVLERDSKGKLQLKKGCQLIFGGDACDRGDGDIRVLSELLDLKKRNPKDVHFILGNRDINKLRLIPELHKSVVDKDPDVYWIKDKKDGIDSTGKLSERMKWILVRTMGSPLSFEYRRQELKALGLKHDDISVAKSYVELVCPTVLLDKTQSPVTNDDWVLPSSYRGILAEFVANGVIYHRIDDTVFVHGGVHENNTDSKDFPDTLKPWARIKSKGLFQSGVNILFEIKELVLNGSTLEYDLNAKNRLVEWEMQDFNKQINANEVLSRGYTWARDGNYDDIQSGSRLAQYGMGWFKDGSKNTTYVYEGYIRDKNGQTAPSTSFIKRINGEMGVKRIIVGHNHMAIHL